jgi:hypothetical protein
MSFAINNLPPDALRDFCMRWGVVELALFGSALRADFNPASDIDLLVSFAPDTQWSLLDHVQMQEELTAILDRPVDLISRRAIERSANPIRRRAILESAQVICTT